MFCRGQWDRHRFAANELPDRGRGCENPSWYQHSLFPCSLHAATRRDTAVRSTELAAVTALQVSHLQR
jgi:hypothetical protein